MRGIYINHYSWSSDVPGVKMRMSRPMHIHILPIYNRASVPRNRWSLNSLSVNIQANFSASDILESRRSSRQILSERKHSSEQWWIQLSNQLLLAKATIRPSCWFSRQLSRHSRRINTSRDSLLWSKAEIGIIICGALYAVRVKCRPTCSLNVLKAGYDD